MKEIKPENELFLTEKTYEDGLNDAWKLARKIQLPKSKGGFSAESLEDMFGAYNYELEILENFSATEAMEKVQAWKTKVHVGDVVMDESGKLCVVTYNEENIMTTVLRENGATGVFPYGVLTKTGRTLDVAGFLKQIGDAE